MSAINLQSLSKEEMFNFINSFETVLSDCDGVLWLEAEAIQGSPEVVQRLKDIGKKFFYVTNNNTKTRAEFVEKCTRLNYQAKLNEVMCTSYLAAEYLKEKNFNKKVYIVGTSGIAKELEAAGIKYIGLEPDPPVGNSVQMITDFKPDPEVGAVVVGFDDQISYPKIFKAATYVQDPNVLFIGTNCDNQRPSPNSNISPGSGCMLRVIEAAANRKAVLLGKPEPYISQALITNYGLNPAKTLMIGDKGDTDILLGKNCGFKTLLVLSGVTSAKDIQKWKTSDNNTDRNLVPDYYTNRLGDLLPALSVRIPGIHLKSLKRNEVEKLLGSFDTILSDCDGVLWLVYKPIKGVPETVKKLKESGKRFFYVTNNPLSTRQEFSNQLQAVGYEVKPEEVVGTAYLVATYLKSINFSKKVYLLGSESIGRELDLFGIPHIGGGPDIMTPELKTTILSFVPDKEVGAVVVSLDEHLSCLKLMKAANYLNDPNVLFIATSMETHLPLPKGKLPGPGAIVKCVEACSGRVPIILGKPALYMKEAIAENFNVIPERTLFIGDSLHTDILTGKRCGVKTLLVLSGVTTEDDVKALNESSAELIPDFYTDSLADIHQYL